MHEKNKIMSNGLRTLGDPFLKYSTASIQPDADKSLFPFFDEKM